MATLSLGRRDRAERRQRWIAGLEVAHRAARGRRDETRVARRQIAVPGRRILDRGHAIAVVVELDPARSRRREPGRLAGVNRLVRVAGVAAVGVVRDPAAGGGASADLLRL